MARLASESLVYWTKAYGLLEGSLKTLTKEIKPHCLKWLVTDWQRTSSERLEDKLATKTQADGLPLLSELSPALIVDLTLAATSLPVSTSAILVLPSSISPKSTRSS
ncbi:unnamed protein product [Ambrosiozyma monospora]|uniref:Unnamed protein product n=1 Tax=Ambrosiozyma monospora TaxID=43982 RepID=A0ACB5U845_AMBMO|nr:unnamed protein product [Ambrosiozyma monospora]